MTLELDENNDGSVELPISRISFEDDEQLKGCCISYLTLSTSPKSTFINWTKWLPQNFFWKAGIISSFSLSVSMFICSVIELVIEQFYFCSYEFFSYSYGYEHP